MRSNSPASSWWPARCFSWRRNAAGSRSFLFRGRGAGRRERILLGAAGAALTMAPWMVRAVVLTGNPVAPLMNRVFQSAYFHIATEQEMAANMGYMGRQE